MAKKPTKASKKFRAAKTVKDANPESSPVEVIVHDCVLHERVIAEYRNESKWWFGTRMFKVYHPCFTETPDSSRWVLKLGRILGPTGNGGFVDVKAEREMIRELTR